MLQSNDLIPKRCDIKHHSGLKKQQTKVAGRPFAADCGRGASKGLAKRASTKTRIGYTSSRSIRLKSVRDAFRYEYSPPVVRCRRLFNSFIGDSRNYVVISHPGSGKAGDQSHDWKDGGAR